MAILRTSRIFIDARVRIVNDPMYGDRDNPMSGALFTAIGFLHRAQAHLGIEGCSDAEPLSCKLYESLEQAGGSPAPQGKA